MKPGRPDNARRDVPRQDLPVPRLLVKTQIHRARACARVRPKLLRVLVDDLPVRIRQLDPNDVQPRRCAVCLDLR